MKIIFTHDNVFIVHNIRNILENAGINVTLKNEYAAGASGDLAPLDTWLEVWLIHERDEVLANSLIQTALSCPPSASWTCSHCNEVNDGSFEICWQCQQ